MKLEIYNPIKSDSMILQNAYKFSGHSIYTFLTDKGNMYFTKESWCNEMCIMCR